MIELRIPCLNPYKSIELVGAERTDLDKTFPQYDLIRQIERKSILEFMTQHRTFLIGDVLDFGSGEQPYRSLVSGTYRPHELEDLPLREEPTFDCIMCNQVFQYLVNVQMMLGSFYRMLHPNGYVVITYAANWDEVEESDLQRFTKAGMNRMLIKTGFKIISHMLRARVCFDNFKFPLGYGVVAQKI